MKHASSRELFAYWDGLRGPHPAPERGEIEPGPIRKALGDVFLLAFDPAAGHPFRLAGTRACALFGQELKGRSFVALWGAESRSVADLVAGVADEATGLVAGATGTTAEGWSHDLEMTLLPLRHRGDTRARLIGTLAPLQAPFWLGAGRIHSLALTGFRHLHPATADIAIQAGRSVRTTRLGGLFTVYEGGRR